MKFIDEQEVIVTKKDGGYTRKNIVFLEHMGEEFIGEARLHPDDKDYYSAIVGGTIAEARATIKALKYELKVKKDLYKTQKNFVKACEQYKNFDKTSSTARAIYRQLNRLRKQIREIQTDIQEITDIIAAGIKKREKFIQRTKKENK